MSAVIFASILKSNSLSASDTLKSIEKEITPLHNTVEIFCSNTNLAITGDSADKKIQFESDSPSLWKVNKQILHQNLTYSILHGIKHRDSAGGAVRDIFIDGKFYRMKNPDLSSLVKLPFPATPTAAPGSISWNGKKLSELETCGVGGDWIEQVQLKSALPVTSNLSLNIYANLNSNCLIQHWQGKDLHIRSGGNSKFVLKDCNLSRLDVCTDNFGSADLELNKLKEISAVAMGHSQILITVNDCDAVHVKQVGDGKVVVRKALPPD